ncbi:N-acetylgalactosamine-6-sulfatase [Echinicola pacifica]|uniref:N-acetylgalactosamine-6-sulfatase n=1 Tax=Echinicola pacifica TaxID=346377 RepID=A0A918PW27_9BACT|nr:arylsulfatase [Echinicola pacifica]GGZ24855.1 N-acetylgalactosamine-6-sulfatase [Echinicola pacifica]
MKNQLLFGFLIAALVLQRSFAQSTAFAPNVILILTDDQGIGDLACHGNPWINTPNIDAFYEEAVRMTDFHVSPMCTPTRAAIMTGQYPIHNGAWATYKGRDMLAASQQTMADIFLANGYQTALFGKWHLGDNYPSRPTDSGFGYAVHHKAGGVNELSDYWGNSYFDDVYYVNNTPTAFEGYCTDVWFEEAMKYMKQQKEDPFFVYLATNAPHSPFYVDEKYSDPYKPLEEAGKIVDANFYGMISNLDENFGKLREFLSSEGLAENTIIIYMTDNGSSAGISADGKTGYNMGLRGKKGSPSEGGHRVPFFIHWPQAGILGGKDLAAPAQHVDLIPTLASLCDLDIPDDQALDGMDFSPLLLAEEQQLPPRNLFIHHRQDWRPPHALQGTCIINGAWRLVNGTELYDIEQDRMQLKDLSASHPEQLEEMLEANALFIEEARETDEYQQLPVVVIGHPAQEEITLTIQHAIGEDQGIWMTEQVAAGMKNTNNTHALEVASSGTYIISLRRWPMECPGPIWGIPAHNPKGRMNYQTIHPQKASIRIANQIHEKEIVGTEEAVEFRLQLEKGKTLLVNDFLEGDERYGVYYTYISKVD